MGAVRGGVAHVFDRVVCELRERGHAVTVIAVPARRTPAWSGIRAALSARRALRAAGTVHLEFGANDTEAFWFALAAVLLRGDCVVVAHDYPELIHEPGAGLLPTSSRAGSALAYRVLSPLLDSLLGRILLRRAGVVVVFGEAARAGWLGRGAHRVEVVGHGGEPATDDAPPPSRGDSVLFAGFLNQGKGIDTLLQAWALISERTELPLVLAGEPNDPAWFHEALSPFTQVANPPRVLGPVPGEREFQALIGRAAVVVLPYRYSSPASGVLVRALSAGRAVIATPMPAMRDTVRHGENGVLVPVDDPQALAAAIMRLCDSPAERDRLGAAAAETALRRFSWTSHVDGLEAIYRGEDPAATRGARTWRSGMR
ncbi:MAG: glycosyltransferase family 4 protein [Actinomycetota bacterium]|nr:glycosyltransferase family 4 protein [Actinomycetota bacterium]